MCKKPVEAKLYIKTPDGATGKPFIRVYMHERGCMGAKNNHLDIVFPGGLPEVLKDLLHVKGVTASCIMDGVLRVNLPIGVILEVSIRGLDVPVSRWRCRLRKKNNYEIYLSLN